MKNFRKIYKLLNNNLKNQAFFVLALTFLSMLFETIGVGLFVPMILLLTQNNIIQQYPIIKPLLDIFNIVNQKELISFGLFALVLIYLVKNIFLGYFNHIQNKFANNIQMELSNELYSIYLRQPYIFHLKNNSAQLIRNVTVEINQLQMYVTQIMLLCTEISIIFGITLILFLSEPIGVILVVIFISLISFAFNILSKKYILKWAKIRLFHSGQLLQQIMQGFGGIKDVKILGREKHFIENYAYHVKITSKSNRNNSTLLGLPRLWLEQIMIFGLAFLIFVMIYNNKPISFIIPTLGLFAIGSFRILPSVNRVLNTIQSLRYGTPSLDLIFNELNLPIYELKNKFLKLNFTKLTLSDIYFNYKDIDKPALQGISLNILSGQKIGFIGTSGSGKSTLIDLILGLLKPVSGQILVNDLNINENENYKNWLSIIGYVPQNIFLTDDTLRKNIAFGINENLIDDNLINEVIKLAQLDDFVNSVEEGINLFVGERGVRLSGGQKQRIGIARALYQKPQVLVLDEATSSLDNNTETEVINAIDNLKDLTIIMVAHRLTTVKNCDIIFKIEKGRILESGNPSQILN